MSDQNKKESMDNRLDLCLKRELKRASRHKEPLTIVIIECHIEDDELRKDSFIPIFKEIAGIVRKIIRDEDTEIILGRNIILVLPVTFLDGARKVAEKIEKKVRQHKFKKIENNSEFEINLIFGFANYPNDGYVRNELLETARDSLGIERERLLGFLSERL